MNHSSERLQRHDMADVQTFDLLATHLGSIPGAVLRYLGATSRRAARRRALYDIDDVALRDLGLRRSELDSCWAESEGLAPTTRLRLSFGPWR